DTMFDPNNPCSFANKIKNIKPLIKASLIPTNNISIPKKPLLIIQTTHRNHGQNK
ncbi:17029_t:CDS:1, partial [Funneliformis caledonium]